ncbi:hypothetical protein [Citrobacter telavivensis]
MKPTYEELEARCAALAAELKQSKIDADCYKKGMEASNARLVQIAAELSAIDAIHNDAVFITDSHYEQCPPGVQKIVGALAVLQIPAYQSFLAEVRASAVDEVCLKISNAIVNCYQDELVGLDEAATICGDFASEIRKGVQS